MKLRIWFMAAMFVMMGTYAFACQAAGAPAAAPTATSTTSAILLAALNGALVGVVGWLSQRKSADGSHEAFDPVQLIITVLVGAGIGAVAAWRKKSFGDVQTWIENSGYVTLAEIALKAVWRNASVTITGVLATLKGGSANPTVPAIPASTPPAPPKP
jgi:hypothetical protein